MASLHDSTPDDTRNPLPTQLVGLDPWALFGQWLDEAHDSGEAQPRAMTLSTVGAGTRPSSRVVMLRAHSERGLVFYTSYESRKSRALATHPVASALFWWPGLHRQVRAIGATMRIPRPRSEEYFAGLARRTQVLTWASMQSKPLRSRDDLRNCVREIEVRYAGGEVPCPPTWGGFLIDVDSFEFWQGMADGLHDRVVMQRREQGWRGERLQP